MTTEVCLSHEIMKSFKYRLIITGFIFIKILCPSSKRIISQNDVLNLDKIEWSHLFWFQSVNQSSTYQSILSSIIWLTQQFSITWWNVQSNLWNIIHQFWWYFLKRCQTSSSLKLLNCAQFDPVNTRSMSNKNMGLAGMFESEFGFNNLGLKSQTYIPFHSYSMQYCPQLKEIGIWYEL